AGAIRQVEAAGLPQLLVELLEARNDARDVVANHVVVLGHGHPVGHVGAVRAEGGDGNARQNGDLAHHLALYRYQHALVLAHHAHRVFAARHLVATLLHVDIGVREAR
nr:hypothetical protein [Tanacetum cinerariifolium]